MKKFYCIAIMIITLMCTAFQVSASEYEYYEDNQFEVSVCIAWGVGVGLAGAALFTIIEVKKHKPVARAAHADYYIKNGDAKMLTVMDDYLHSSEVKTKVVTSDKKEN